MVYVLCICFFCLGHNNKNKRRTLKRKIMNRKNLKYETCNPQHQQLMASSIWHNCNPTITFNSQYYSVLSLCLNPWPHKTFHCILSFRQNPRSHKTFHHLQLISVFTHTPPNQTGKYRTLNLEGPQLTLHFHWRGRLWSQHSWPPGQAASTTTPHGLLHLNCLCRTMRWPSASSMGATSSRSMIS